MRSNMIKKTPIQWPKNFSVFILSHARADRVVTYDVLRKSGYTGPIRVLVDDQDPQLAAYQEKFKDQLCVFNKATQRKKTDMGDNHPEMNTPLLARNANFEIAAELGIEWFIQLDDDYTYFYHKKDHNDNWLSGKPIKDLDSVFWYHMEYYKNTTFDSIALGQGGDYIGGGESSCAKPKRKVMNSFFLSTHRPFRFVARLNDDVSTYATLNHQGKKFITLFHTCLIQKQTQSNPGGLTELYLKFGTYVKSFYSTMYAPSSMVVAMLQTQHTRIHHKTIWRCAAPCILNPQYRK